MARAKGGELAEVVRYATFDGGMKADLAVGALQNSGIPAVRFPGHAGLVFDGALGGLQPVRVLVPQERLEAARKLLLEIEEAAPEASDDAEERDGA